MSSGKYILYKPVDEGSNDSLLDGNKHVRQQLADDYTTQLLRYVAEVCLSLPIAVLGIIGNLVSFIILCHQRRQKLQTITVLLQVGCRCGQSRARDAVRYTVRQKIAPLFVLQ